MVNKILTVIEGQMTALALICDLIRETADRDKYGSLLDELSAITELMDGLMQNARYRGW